MASWADEANGEMGSVDQENFKAERIISQTKDGREMVRSCLLCVPLDFRRRCKVLRPC